MLPLVSLVTALSVAGQESTPTAAAPSRATAETSVIGAMGGLVAPSTPGVALAALATHRIGAFELGFDASAGGGIAHRLGLGGVGGLHVGDRFAVRALGALGVHRYQGVGRSSLFGEDRGVAGSTPYVGGRLMVSYSFSPHPTRAHRVLVGVLGTVDRDLERYEKSSISISTPWLIGGEAQVTTRTHTIGQTSGAVLAVLGIELDWSRYY